MMDKSDLTPTGEDGICHNTEVTTHIDNTSDYTATESYRDTKDDQPGVDLPDADERVAYRLSKGTVTKAGREVVRPDYLNAHEIGDIKWTITVEI